MIKHITLGTKEKFFYDYNGENLPLRPISSFELDQSFYNSLIYADEEIADLVVKIKLSIINVKTKIEIDNKKVAELKKFFDDVDYWIVYYGMKDFQDEDFEKSGLEIVKKMDNIHQIATRILTYSYQPKDVIKEIVRSEDGKIVATIVFNLNVPLAEYGSMTKLQRDFLILSKTTPLEKDIEKSGDKMNLRDMLKEIV